MTRPSRDCKGERTGRSSVWTEGAVFEAIMKIMVSRENTTKFRKYLENNLLSVFTHLFMKISAAGIQIEVQNHAPRRRQPLVLLAGMGMPLTAWPPGFIRQLTEAGFRVVCFDHRDTGLSQSFDHLGTPDLLALGLLSTLGLPVRAPYSLADMADDTAALIEALGLESAHVCGMSMGGMVAQHLAVRHPHRVRSLTLMMTSSGSRRLPQPSWRVRQALMASASGNAEESADRLVQLVRLIGSPGYPFDEDELRKRAHISARRAFRPQASARHLAAILADGDRSPMLGGIAAPTLVLHGCSDPVVPVQAAHDLADKIPGAAIELIEGWGHDLPEPLWPRLGAAITRVSRPH